MGASPRLDRDCEMLDSIPGSVPNLISPPAGCKFHPRCDRLLPICSEQSPVLREKTVDIGSPVLRIMKEVHA